MVFFVLWTSSSMPEVLVSNGTCMLARSWIPMRASVRSKPSGSAPVSVPRILPANWCGMGRFADVATRWGAHVVGIDLSLAAEVAARNLAGRKATILQADVFHLPFVPESFDFIYSIGVLHHTPD